MVETISRWRGKIQDGGENFKMAGKFQDGGKKFKMAGKNSRWRGKYSRWRGKIQDGGEKLKMAGKYSQSFSSAHLDISVYADLNAHS